MKNRIRFPYAWQCLALVAAVAIMATGCSTLNRLGIGEDAATEGAKLAIRRQGLEGAVSDAQLKEIVSIIKANQRLNEIGEEVARDERVQAKIDALVAKYVRDGKVFDPQSVTNSVTNSVETSDAAPFDVLRWSYGGVDGGGAALSAPRIRDLSITGSKLTFSYDVGLAAWGLADGDAGALACLFVKASDGTWRGGKFDWISTSRESRGLENILEGYAGWTLEGVPNPCDAAFLVLSRDGSKRSNVAAATWKR